MAEKHDKENDKMHYRNSYVIYSRGNLLYCMAWHKVVSKRAFYNPHQSYRCYMVQKPGLHS